MKSFLYYIKKIFVPVLFFAKGTRIFSAAVLSVALFIMGLTSYMVFADTFVIYSPTSGSVISEPNWYPSVDFSEDNDCEISYDGANYVPVSCVNGGMDIPPPASYGQQILYIQATGATNQTDQSVSFTYGTLGCTDSGANNYDPDAVEDSGGCTYDIPDTPGCTDPGASNYDPNATSDDGSCNYAVYGCTDISASNYDPSANTDDSSCVYSGCTDSSATNFDPIANMDDGSCTYDAPGCTDSTANNYDPAANVDNGTCTYNPPDNPPEIYGCTDSGANNYDPSATSDDGSCTYNVPGCTDNTADNYDPAANVDNGTCTYSPPEVYGCTDPAANNYDPSATVNDNTCTYNMPDVYGCLDPAANNYDPAANVDNNSCTYNIPVVYGCTDITANNYNSSATSDDGSCTFNNEGGGSQETSSAPLTPVLPAESDTGSSDADHVIDYGTSIPLTGMGAPANALIKVCDSDCGSTLTTTTSDGGGNWSATIPSLSEGTHSIITTATESGKTESAGSNPLVIVVDTTTSTISDVSAEPTSSGAIISWHTNENTLSSIEFGLSNAYGLSASINSFAADHSINLNSLLSGTLYYFRILGSDLAGNTATGTQDTFTTLEAESSGRSGVTSGSQASHSTVVPQIVFPVITPSGPNILSPSNSVVHLGAGTVFTRTLVFGSFNEDVRMLQRFLNARGFTVTTVGNGSPGHEIRRFGPATFAALKKFQKAVGISPTGNLGLITQSYINSVLKKK